ncbi:GGDEF domain-containing protein [Piscinibacter sp. HJYY11]|uniref:GGDEF domain-containing protein n=1 Tax=Piscinibacter sp. HJYY11 TaxID=2801333 RepID=UPI00191DA368|nr:GGDEF domain-containing protein [Piscinibacter sp. HJYY11]MBL0726479.1 GGDEF domain-containing protein [Piscinibacter sp. HJYY11]
MPAPELVGATPLPAPFPQAKDEASPQRFTWLLGHEPRMRTYLSRTMVNCLPYGVGTLVAVQCAALGVMSTALATALVVSRALSLLAIYLALRSGWSQRFRDPSLSLLQVVTALLWTATMYLLSGPMHTAMLPLLVLSMASATFHLDATRARHITWFAVLLMTGVMGAATLIDSQVYAPKVQFCLWVIMASILPTGLLNSMQLKRLKHRLRTQREELRVALTRLHDLATHDELTGLANRAHMGEMLEQYLQRHRDGGEIFSIALLDLDFFKRVNDTHGHGVGDEVLKAFAEAMRHTVRESDLPARWGGEEFLILLPQSGAENARLVLERLREHFGSQVVSPSVPSLRASFSAGIVSPAPGETLAMALARADQALYAAKTAGRDRCCLG